MGFVVMLVVTICVFFVLRAFVGSLLAIIVAVAIHIAWWVINKRAATKGLFKANIYAYLKNRAAGESIEESLMWVIKSRYPMSEEKRAYILTMFTEVDPKGDEMERLKALVYVIFCHENGPPPTIELEVEYINEIDKLCNSMSRKYVG